MTLKSKFRLTVAVAALGLLGLSGFWVYGERSHLLALKEEQARNLVAIPYSIIVQQYRLQSEGRISREEAQRGAIELIKGLRGGGGNYFWINDMHPTMVMHPIAPQLDGQDLTNYRDPQGKALFVEMVATVREQGQGFVRYRWPKPGREKEAALPKISFVEGFAPWGWVIGTGIYLDDVDAVWRAHAAAAVAVAAGCLWALLLVAISVMHSIFPRLSLLVDQMESVARGGGDFSQVTELHHRGNRSADDEVTVLMAGFNEMLIAIRKRDEDLRRHAEELEQQIAARTADLGAAHEEVRLFLECIPSILIGLDHRGVVTLWNKTAARIFGLDEHEAKGRSLIDCGIKWRSPDMDKQLVRWLETDSITRCDDIGYEKAGGVGFVGFSIRPVLSKQKKKIGFIVTGAEVTEKKNLETQRRQAELELRASRQMLQSILDAIPQRVFWKGRNCTYLGCNRPFAIDAGLDDPAAIVGKSDFDLSWAGMAELYRADDKLVMERGAAKLNCQGIQKRPDGHTLWLQTNKLPLFDLEGNVTGIVGTYEDITDRKRAEKEFRLTQFSLEHASDAVEWIDPESRIVYVNEAECRALGYSREELLSLTIPDIDPIFRKEVWATFWMELKTRGSMAFETQHKNKQGLVFPVEVTANYLDFDGQEYCFAFARDITERKRSETELRLTQFAVEHASDPIERVDREGHLVYVNEAGRRDLGYCCEELLTLSVSDINPHFSKENWQKFWSEIKTRRSITFEGEHKTKQGQIFPVEITANYMEFDGQEYVFAFPRNVAERRALESQLRQAQKLEGIGQLAAGIAHEINTPAQFVSDNTTFLKESSVPLLQLLSLGQDMRRNADGGLIPKELLARFDQLMEESDLSYLEKEIPRALEQSLDGLQRISKIVRAMKEFSHPGTGEKVPTDINRAIETTITVARNEWKYVAELDTELDHSLPLVPCLPGEFNQVILNLIVNAAQAIASVAGDGSKGKGRITITTRRAEQSVEITIRDTGPGIPGEIQSRIFEPFFTTKPVGKGTGQGLSLAHSAIVKRHGGRIWFETEVGRGTTFFLQLPFQVSAATAAGG